MGMGPDSNTIQSLREIIKKELAGLYPEREIESITEVLLQHRLNIMRHEAYSRKKEVLVAEDSAWFSRAIDRLKESTPVQHITGETEFFGLRLKVGPQALIPRQETEELVQWILEDRSGTRTPSMEPLRILDIGTGTGCIALALARNFPDAAVYATDIESRALNLARENARRLGLRVDFLMHDIRLHPGIPEKFSGLDLIVSNPPYVPYHERESMHPNVRESEPPSALFVPDEDPLVYYRSIAGFGRQALKRGGLLFLEIHERYGSGVREILAKSGFKEIVLRKDIHGKDRMIRAGRDI